jgi:hypothetical protein
MGRSRPCQATAVDGAAHTLRAFPAPPGLSCHPPTTLQGTRQLIWQHPVVFAALIGVAGALLTIGFREAIHGVETLAYGRSDSLVSIARSLQGWQRVLPPVIGGVVAGLLLRWTQRWVREEHGGDYMEAIALGNGELDVRRSLLKALSSLATVASGGAIGREGPMVQLAALAGSLFGRWWQLPVPRRRLYVACGAAAGIATAYNAPIAGAVHRRDRAELAVPGQPGAADRLGLHRQPGGAPAGRLCADLPHALQRSATMWRSWRCCRWACWPARPRRCTWRCWTRPMRCSAAGMRRCGSLGTGGLLVG